ncbi:129_t:CDS:10 [Entrophospora sp. SA101]|nr:129_t:CDS:10 [Entrophospora sp. SA101]
MQERQVNWMLSCPNPTPLAFFQYIVPTHRVRATEKYYQALDLALSETDNHGLQNLVRRSIHSTNLNIHEEINTFAQNKDMPSAKRVRIDGVKTLIDSLRDEERMDNKDGELEVYAKETIRNDGKKWIIYDTDVHNSLTKWKQERVQPRTDLAFYDIIDISPGSNSGFVQSLPRDVVHEIRRSKSLSTPNMDNIDGMKDYIIDFIKKKNFRNYVDESYMKTRINNTTKFIWDYLNFLVESFERDNDLADYNLSELGYHEIFLTPLMRSLFRGMHQEMMALTTSRDTPSIESEQTPIYQNENQSISEAPINQSQSAISSKIKIPYNQRIEQGLIQEAILFIQKGVLTSPINNLKTQESDVNIGNDKGGRELAQLFSDAEIAEGKMVEAKQKEIICWYTYREAYQNSVAEIQSKTGIAEKTAKTQVYIMIKASLPKVSDVNLYKKTQRAGTIYKLFGKIIDPITQKEVKGIGIDKAYGISYGAKSISELTNVQILNIIKQVTEKSHDILTNGQDRTKPFGSNDLAETKSRTI